MPFPARYPGTCAYCRRGFRKNDMIIRYGGRYEHVGCREEDEREQNELHGSVCPVHNIETALDGTCDDCEDYFARLDTLRF